MSGFKLYERLSNIGMRTEINTTALTESLRSIRSIDRENAVKIYTTIQMLIIHHNYLKTGILSESPYTGKTCVAGKGIIYKLSQEFPLDLLNIIDSYLEETLNIK